LSFKTWRNGTSRDKRMAFSFGEGGRRGRRFGSAAPLAEINIVPLVDVVLVLLVLFMITANVMDFGLDINVPKVKTVRDTAHGFFDWVRDDQVEGVPVGCSADCSEGNAVGEAIVAGSTVGASVTTIAPGTVGSGVGVEVCINSGGTCLRW